MEVFFLLQKNKLLVIPLGGLGEIGKNMTVFQYGDDIVILDAGLAFPEDEMFGIDLVIPDMSYLAENRDKIRAVVLTHGHEDHIGALSYLLREFNVPVYGTRLALALVECRLKENNVSGYNLVTVQAGDEIKAGVFQVGFIQGSHSIPDACGIYFKTPIGTVIHTGDFKMDQTPVDGKKLDIHKFSELGDKGVLLLLSDSTNAERPGYTGSEKDVAKAIDEEIKNASGRVIMATFSSNVSRLQQAIYSACRHKRKVAVFGRSMSNVIAIAQEIGYLDIDEGVIIDPEELRKYQDSQILILTTGSQGEPMAGLSRMANNNHRNISVVPTDTILIAANPIPGNEASVSKTINKLLMLGANVIYEKISGIHVSGHASQEELKLMLNLVRPKFFIPVHGEFRMLSHQSRMAQELGIPKENIFIGENGDVFEFTANSGVSTRKVKAGNVYVDGLGVGDVGNIVIRDRKQLSQEGVVIVVLTVDSATGAIVAGPDIVSRGFVYVRDAEVLMHESRDIVALALEKIEQKNMRDWAGIKTVIREALGRHLGEKTGRRPMILPIIMEV
ncbi:ribonuclease J [Massilibacillus massiliensis]